MGEQDMAWILEQRNLDAVSKAPPYPLRNGLYLAPMQTALWAGHSTSAEHLGSESRSLFWTVKGLFAEMPCVTIGVNQSQRLRKLSQW